MAKKYAPPPVKEDPGEEGDEEDHAEEGVLTRGDPWQR